MKFLSLLLFFAILVLNAQAHDYQTVYTHRKALFKNSSNQILGISVDSVKMASDTILYPFATMQEVSPGCFTPFKASWIGEKVVVKPDGSNLFFNREGDTITLKTKAGINQSWIAFQRADTFRVEANVQTIELENFLGLSDTVKTIGFTVVDQQGNSVANILNSLKVKISKTYGFIETLNFYLFPDIVVRYPTDRLGKYILVGLTNPKVGIKNLTWFDVNNFEVGDELHIREHNIWYDNFSSIKEYDNRCIYKYMERTNYADSIVYRYARKQSIETIYKDSTTLKTNNDTLKSVILNNPAFDKLPGEPIITADWAYQMYMRNDEFLMKIDPREVLGYVFNENCWSVIAGEGCLFEKRYMEGLGGPYYSCTDYFFHGSKKRELVYYKKGETEWGEQLIITSISHLNERIQVQVFPNPAYNVVTFRLNDEATKHIIKLYNNRGRLLKFEQYYGSSFQLQLTGLKSGIYFYQIITSGSMQHIGKLIVEKHK